VLYTRDMEAAEVLTIILSVTLTIFLVVAIVLGVMLIKVVKSVKTVTSKAEEAANNLAQAAKYIKPASLTAGLTRAIKQAINPKKRR
jgi:K+-sensing histidine kinase KdpD